MTTIVYRSSDVTQSGQYIGSGTTNPPQFTTNVGATNIVYGITNNIVTTVSINFFCNASGISGYTDIVIGPTTGYAIYSPFDALTPLFNSTGPNAVATNIPITGGTIKISATGEQHSNSEPSASQTVTFNLSFNLSVISASTDFVFVNTSSLPFNNILFLPALAESQTSNSKLLFIKDKTGNANVNNSITVVANEGVSIDNKNAPFTIVDNFACLTLFNNGIDYFIANYYPSSNNQPIMPNTGSTIVPTVYANNNTVNTFVTSSSNGRNTGTNSIYLRNPGGAPGISIIIYFGSAEAGSRLSTNPLLIVPDGCVIDNIGGGDFLLYVDDPLKSCGAVFITDGTNWYVAGYYNSTNWNWTTYVPLPGSETSLTQTSATDIILKRPTGIMDPAFSTPQINSSIPYLCIIKKQGIPLGSNTNYFSYAQGNPTSGNFNLNCNNINYSEPQNNTCLWLVGHQYNGGFSYDPVIGYSA